MITHGGNNTVTYGFGDREISEAIERMLADRPLAARLESISQRLRASPGTERAADLIEGVARDRREPSTGSADSS